MQSHVRFYITETDDQPVVRTMPVPARAPECAPHVEAPVAASTPAVEAKPTHPSVKAVAGRVRSVVKRVQPTA